LKQLLPVTVRSLFGQIALLKHSEVNTDDRMLVLNPDRVKNGEKRHIVLSDKAVDLLADFHTGNELAG